MLIDEHEIQTFEVVVGVLLVLLSLTNVLFPTKCTSLNILRQVVCLNILKYRIAMGYNQDSSKNIFWENFGLDDFTCICKLVDFYVCLYSIIRHRKLLVICCIGSHVTNAIDGNSTMAT